MLFLPEDGGAGESCIFFKLSNSGLELGAGREADEAAGITAGRVNVKGGLAAGGVSVAEVGASSEEERQSSSKFQSKGTGSSEPKILVQKCFPILTGGTLDCRSQ